MIASLTLSQQLFLQNARVFIKFQEMLKDVEKKQPFIAAGAEDKVPITLEFADPWDENLRYVDFQVAGILCSHIKDSLPSAQFYVKFFVWFEICSNLPYWQRNLLARAVCDLLGFHQADGSTEHSQSRSKPEETTSRFH